MRKRSILFALVLLPVAAMAQGKTPTHFDVIAVKPHKPGPSNMSGWRWTSSGVEMTNVAVRTMIAASDRVERWLVFGLPQWADGARWDVSAKVIDPETKPIDKMTNEERSGLLGSILTDRFGLVAHREEKVQPVFLMTVLPGSLKMKQSPPLAPGEAEPKFGRGSMMINNGVMEGHFVTMPFLAATLTGQAERTVLDRTGIAGDYDFELKWQPEDRSGNDNGAAEMDTASSIFTALKEQLGLKLSADKAPVPTVVVDKIVEPEEN